jgi:hypothetical protein
MKQRYCPTGTTAGSQACYILMDDSMHGKDRPTHLVGRVRPQSTKDRDNPPDPISDFPCGEPYSPFGKGHIMALQLGGPDISENIVPQYQEWQENGDWRKMETWVYNEAFKGSYLFVAHLQYGNGENDQPAQTARFYEDGEVFAWKEYRIPTDFTIWLVAEGSTEGQHLIDKVLSPGAVNRHVEMANLGVLLNKVQTVNDQIGTQLDQWTMPDVDRCQWEDRFYLKPCILASFDVYKEVRSEEVAFWKEELESEGVGRGRAREEMADLMRSPVHTMTTTFVLDKDDEIRDLIFDEYGGAGQYFTSRTDVDNLSTHRLLHAYTKEIKSGKQQNDLMNKRRANFKARESARKTFFG